MTWIVDASVATKWFVQEGLHAESLLLLDRPDRLAAPDLIVAEVANIASKKCLRGEIARPQADAMAAAIGGYIAMLQPSAELAERALDIALSLNHPVYDCLYLACAESLGGTLVSADVRFAADLHGTRFAGLILHPGDPDFATALSAG